MLQLIDGAEAVSSAGWSHAINVSVLIERQAAAGAGAVAASSELVDHGLRPGSTGVFGQLENYAAAAFTGASATGDSGAVDVAVGIERDAFVGLAAVGASVETVED